MLTPGVAVPLSEVRVRVSRSSGPGGQHANVTASRVVASFDIAASSSLTDVEKHRLTAALGPRPTAVAQETRSQSRNRELALDRLRGRLAAALSQPPTRRTTKPSKGAEERRLEEKRRAGRRKRERRRPATDE